MNEMNDKYMIYINNNIVFERYTFFMTKMIYRIEDNIIKIDIIIN